MILGHCKFCITTVFLRHLNKSYNNVCESGPRLIRPGVIEQHKMQTTKKPECCKMKLQLSLVHQK